MPICSLTSAHLQTHHCQESSTHHCSLIDAHPSAALKGTGRGQDERQRLPTGESPVYTADSVIESPASFDGQNSHLMAGPETGLPITEAARKQEILLCVYGTRPASSLFPPRHIHLLWPPALRAKKYIYVQITKRAVQNRNAGRTLDMPALGEPIKTLLSQP